MSKAKQTTIFPHFFLQTPKCVASNLFAFAIPFFHDGHAEMHTIVGLHKNHAYTLFYQR